MNVLDVKHCVILYCVLKALNDQRWCPLSHSQTSEPFVATKTQRTSDAFGVRARSIFLIYLFRSKQPFIGITTANNRANKTINS